MLHGSGKNYTFDVFMYNIMELFNEKMILNKINVIFFHQNVLINTASYNTALYFKNSAKQDHFSGSYKPK